MLKCKLLTALFVTILILDLAKEKEGKVDAAPEPCAEFFRFPQYVKHKKSKDNDEKQKAEKRKKKMIEKLNLIEKFLQGLFGLK